jgi:hypothetical protein
MSLYYFHVRNGQDFIKDSRGTNLTDLGAVRKTAIKKARKLLAERGSEMANAEIEITDEGGIIVEAVKFEETKSPNSGGRFFP